MPLTEKINFKTKLQKGNRIQVPQLIRWEFKAETNQLLNVGVNDLETQSGWQFFYTKMLKDGRIVVPLLTIRLLQIDESPVAGHILEVTLEPGQTAEQSM
ncbi:MAG TPA: hypothetical protein VJY36_01900 [Candidatus Bathyarchaeia archaeon]|nr:hypothetical protein [Candidatus Bathyarchaeia archaeon]